MDMYSLGVLLFVMLTGCKPIPSAICSKLAYDTMATTDYPGVKMTQFRRCSPAARDLVLALMQRRPGDRPNALNALGHTWLQQHARAWRERGYDLNYLSVGEPAMREVLTRAPSADILLLRARAQHPLQPRAAQPARRREGAPARTATTPAAAPPAADSSSMRRQPSGRDSAGWFEHGRSTAVGKATPPGSRKGSVAELGRRRGSGSVQLNEAVRPSKAPAPSAPQSGSRAEKENAAPAAALERAAAPPSIAKTPLGAPPTALAAIGGPLIKCVLVLGHRMLLQEWRAPGFPLRPPDGRPDQQQACRQQQHGERAAAAAGRCHSLGSSSQVALHVQDTNTDRDGIRAVAARRNARPLRSPL